MTTPLQKMFEESRQLAEWLAQSSEVQDTIGTMAAEMAEAVRSGGRLLSCGNGGSMCDAMHFAEELSGRYKDDRPAVDAFSISDPGHITCVANDYGFEKIFARGVEAHGREGDVLLVFTTSGNSPNVLAAIEVARQRGLRVHGLLGKGGGKALAVCHQAVVVPATDTGRIQEIHIKVVHALIELVERELFPSNYASSSQAS